MFQIFYKNFVNGQRPGVGVSVWVGWKEGGGPLNVPSTNLGLKVTRVERSFRWTEVTPLPSSSMESKSRLPPLDP